MSEKMPATANHPRRITLELRRDERDQRYRWFLIETDDPRPYAGDTEVSGAHPLKKLGIMPPIVRCVSAGDVGS